MHIRGRLPRDAPDPALELIERLRRMPMAVYGLVPQRHLEDWDAFGLNSGARGGVLESCDVSISYTLWRNPEYIDDPANLAGLDDETRTRLDGLPPDRPRWLIERTRRMRYPLLWNCVVTHWQAAPSDHGGAAAQLVAHVNHVLTNRFSDSRVRTVPSGAGHDSEYAPGHSLGHGPERSLWRGPERGPGHSLGRGSEHGPGEHDRSELDSPVDERHVEHGVTIRVDGFERSGIRIDTDPDVYGVGVALDETSCVTAVLPRDELGLVDVAFSRRRL